MARTDTLGNFLTDVADAIRTKKGTSETIPAEDFDTEIENLPSGGGNKISPSTITFSDDSVGEIDLSILNSSKIKNMSNMFSNSKSLYKVDLSKLDTLNVTNMVGMFSSCGITATSDINYNLKINTSNVITMSSMFSNFCYNNNNNININLDLSTFNTLKVTNMSSMFYNANKIEFLDLSNFETPLLTNTMDMFNGCVALLHIDVRKMEFTQITSYSAMFGTGSRGVPDDCEIIVADDTQKTWITSKFSRLTNVKTVAEYEAEQGE